MLKWFKILLLTVCFAFSCQAFAAIESSSDKLLDSEKHGVVYDHQQKPQTALSESLNFVRLCSSMSEREHTIYSVLRKIRLPIIAD